MVDPQPVLTLTDDVSPEDLMALVERTEEQRSVVEAMTVNRKAHDGPPPREPTLRKIRLPEAVERKYESVAMRESDGATFRGQRIEVDFAREQGMPGMPWSQGRLRLERHTSLTPILARGLGSYPGAFWEKRSMPHVVSVLMDYIGAVAASPWRIEEPELPSWIRKSSRLMKIAEDHFDFAERIWHLWTMQIAERGLLDWMLEMVQYALISGFSLHEKYVKRHSIRWKRATRDILVPALGMRAPWTCREWLFQGETPIGWVQTLSHVIDTQGKVGAWEVPISWEKTLHFSILSAGGSDLEGFSLLVRPGYNMLEMIQEFLVLSALSAEVNGVGTIEVYKADPSAPDLSKPDRTKLREHLLSFRAGHVPWIILPAGYRLAFHSPQNLVPDFTPQVNMLERMSLLGVGREAKLIALSSHGSHAARSSAEGSSELLYDFPKRKIALTLQQLLHWAVSLNFPTDALMGNVFTPHVKYAASRGPDDEARAKVLSAYADKGLLTPTYKDEVALRRRNDLPSITEEEHQAGRRSDNRLDGTAPRTPQPPPGTTTPGGTPTPGRVPPPT